MKDLRSEATRIFHTFLSLSVIIISFILIAMGVFAVKNNTAMIDSGISPAMIYARRENEQVTLQIGERIYENSVKKEIPLTEALKYAPAPVNGIYIIFDNITALIENR